MENLPISGEFKAEITLEGGTGRTTVQSPADISVENGVITAEIVWSSPNYDLMIVGDKEYKPISNENGQSVFIVEIPSLDTPLDIKAETVAMSAPHIIEYTITVSCEELRSESASTSESSGSKSLTEEEAWSIVQSMMSDEISGSGSEQVFYSATVGDSETKSGGGIPPLAVVGISAALGAAVAYVAVTLGKKKKK